MAIGLSPRNLRRLIRRGGQGTAPSPSPAPAPALSPLTLSAAALIENSAAGFEIGALQGVTAGSSLQLTDDAGGRFALSGATLLAGLVATDYEAAIEHQIEVTETLAGASSSPRATLLTIEVINAPDDTTPNPISFTAASGVALGTLTTSNTITPIGFDAPAPIEVTNGEYQIIGQSWTSSPGTFNPGQSVRTRITSPAAYSTTVRSTVTLGGVEINFDVTTLADPASPGVVVVEQSANFIAAPTTPQNGRTHTAATYGAGTGFTDLAAVQPSGTVHGSLGLATIQPVVRALWEDHLVITSQNEQLMIGVGEPFGRRLPKWVDIYLENQVGVRVACTPANLIRFNGAPHGRHGIVINPRFLKNGLNIIRIICAPNEGVERMIEKIVWANIPGLPGEIDRDARSCYVDYENGVDTNSVAGHGTLAQPYKSIDWANGEMWGAREGGYIKVLSASGNKMDGTIHTQLPDFGLSHANVQLPVHVVSAADPVNGRYQITRTIENLRDARRGVSLASFAASFSGTTMTVTAMDYGSGNLHAGATVHGAGLPGWGGETSPGAGLRILAQTGGTPGGVGTYTMSGSATLTDVACTILSQTPISHRMLRFRNADVDTNMLTIWGLASNTKSFYLDKCSGVPLGGVDGQGWDHPTRPGERLYRINQGAFGNRAIEVFVEAGMIGCTGEWWCVAGFHTLIDNDCEYYWDKTYDSRIDGAQPNGYVFANNRWNHPEWGRRRIHQAPEVVVAGAPFTVPGSGGIDEVVIPLSGNDWGTQFSFDMGIKVLTGALAGLQYYAGGTTGAAGQPSGAVVVNGRLVEVRIRRDYRAGRDLMELQPGDIVAFEVPVHSDALQRNDVAQIENAFIQNDSGITAYISQPMLLTTTRPYVGRAFGQDIRGGLMSGTITGDTVELDSPRALRHFDSFEIGGGAVRAFIEPGATASRVSGTTWKLSRSDLPQGPFIGGQSWPSINGLWVENYCHARLPMTNSYFWGRDAGQYPITYTAHVSMPLRNAAFLFTTLVGINPVGSVPQGWLFYPEAGFHAEKLGVRCCLVPDISATTAFLPTDFEGERNGFTDARATIPPGLTQSGVLGFTAASPNLNLQLTEAEYGLLERCTQDDVNASPWGLGHERRVGDPVGAIPRFRVA